MLCPTCNADVPADAAFCPKCGQRLATAAAQVATGGAAGLTPSGGTAGLPSSAAAALPPSAAERLRPGQHAIPHEEEKELWKGSYSPKAIYGGWVFAAAATLAGIVLAVLVPNPAAWIAVLVAIPLIWIAVLATLLY